MTASTNNLIRRVAEGYAREAAYILANCVEPDGRYKIPEVRQILEECGWRDGKFVHHTHEPQRSMYTKSLWIACFELRGYIMVANLANEMLEKFK